MAARRAPGAEPPIRRIRWQEAFRLVPTRYPPIELFERVADPADLEALADIEGLTNPRVRDALGDIHLVAPAERLTGPNASFVMAPFVHRRPSRFSRGAVGVYYGAHSLITAVRECAFHTARFYRATREPAVDFDLRILCGAVASRFHDLRATPERWRRELDPHDWRAGQELGERLRRTDSNGVVYPSVRDKGGQCVGAFRPRAVGLPEPRGVVAFHFDGQRVERWFDHGSERWNVLPSIPGEATG